MIFEKLSIEGLVLIRPDVLQDNRGYFYESFHYEKFAEAGLHLDFVQDNESLSSKNVLRGLHFQHPPFEQGKLVRVMHGAVLDVVVDLRKNSASYGKHYKVELNDTNHTMLWIPPGFAHGFLALSDESVFCYKCTGVYNKQSEFGIIWNDKDLNIDWGITNPVVSAKDLELGRFKDYISVF
ncbi:MAG: dTDP-4-dehydrorhamnose 3,5-epimerase [Bacteroidia bacterium]